MDEIELIQKAKDDNSALELLLHNYEPMIYSLVKKFKISGYTTDDLLQEARSAFCRAVKLYDNTKSKLSTFAYVIMRRRLKDLEKAEYMLKRRAEVISLNTDEDSGKYFDIPSNKPGPEERVIIMERREELREALRGKLTDLEFDVTLAFIEGNSYSDIAQSKNISVKQVDNALQRAKKKMKE